MKKVALVALGCLLAGACLLGTCTLWGGRFRPAQPSYAFRPGAIPKNFRFLMFPREGVQIYAAPSCQGATLGSLNSAALRLGGHDVPEEVIRRRYARSLRNLFDLYQPLADDWSIYDNSMVPSRLLCSGQGKRTVSVVDPEAWARIQEHP